MQSHTDSFIHIFCVFRAKVFCVGWCNASCLGFLNISLLIVFWKIWVVLKRTFKFLTAVVLKRTDCRLGSGSTATAVWRPLTAEEVEAGLVAADVGRGEAVVVGGVAAGAGVLAGENCCGVSICW